MMFKRLLFLSFFAAMALNAEDTLVNVVTQDKNGKDYFDPKEITVHPGDTVTWVNSQNGVHNIVSGQIPNSATPFKSPDLVHQGDKWSYTFKAVGTYLYYCGYHQRLGMVGKVIVK